MAPSVAMSERRRRYPRIRASVGMVVRQGAQTEAATSRTLSLGGIGFVTRKRWQVNQPISLSLIDEGLRVDATGRVVRTSDDHCAVAFGNVDEHRDPMHRLLSRVSQRQSKTNEREGAVPVVFRCMDEAHPSFSFSFMHATMVDADLNGAFVLTRRSPPIGASVVIVLNWDARAETVTRVSGEVVRHEEDGFAVEFRSLEAEKRRFHRAFTDTPTPKIPTGWPVPPSGG